MLLTMLNVINKIDLFSQKNYYFIVNMASGDNIKKTNIQNYKLLPLFNFISQARQKVADRPYVFSGVLLNYIYQEDAKKTK